MSLGRHENFHFEQSPMLIHSTSLRSDGTTGAQNMNASFIEMVAVNGTVANAYVEPEKAITSGNEGHRLDAFSRLIILSTRDGGTGTWSAILNLRRTATGTSVPFAFNIPLETASPIYTLDDPLAHDFMKALGSPALADELFANVELTPGQASAFNVAVVAMLVPGFTSSDSDKGANLSAPQYLIKR